MFTATATATPTLTIISILLDKGRKKRHHRISGDLHHCGGDEGKSMERCVQKTKGFNFPVDCTYRTAGCFYVLRCKHVGYRSTAKYECSKIIHHRNVKTVCCKGIC